ncbi:MAG: flagellar protein FlgN [Firmicutes bacterium]|jgi:uncharacterized protein YejL (UPF0352 family)|nr:flagellar protein FlgN [Bacillota bacterium]MDH7496656.1 flagellar protein FlgN [Bacillota bacterium]
MRDVVRRCNEILGLLEEEVALHRDLLDLSRREQGCLVSFDADALAATLRDVEAVVAKIRAMMDMRLALLREVARDMGMGSDPGRDGAACEEIMSSAGEECAERYRSIVHQLAPVLEEHAVINSGNLVLIGNILDYIDFAAGLCASRKGLNTYSVNATASRRKAGKPYALHFSRP